MKYERVRKGKGEEVPVTEEANGNGERAASEEHQIERHETVGEPAMPPAGPTTMDHPSAEELEVVRLRVDEIMPDPLNPNVESPETFNMLVTTISEDGYDQPVVVCLLTDLERETFKAEPEVNYVLAKGEHRWRASRVLGHQTVPAVIRQWDSLTRRTRLVRDNNVRGETDKEKFTALVHSLQHEHQLDSELASSLLGFDTSKEMFKLMTSDGGAKKNLEEKAVGDKAKDDLKVLDDLSLVLNTLFCYDAETEFLSADGWKRHEEYKPGMVVAAFDAETEGLVWTDDVKLHTFDVQDEPVYAVSGKSTDLVVTRGHRMYVTYSQCEPWVWKMDPIESVVEHQSWWSRTRIAIDPGTTEVGPLELACGTVDPATVLDFVGWFVTGGHFQAQRGTGLAVTQKTHVGAVADCFERLKAAGVPVWGPRLRPDGTVRWYAAHAHLKTFVEEFCGRGAKNKALPWAWTLLVPWQSERLFGVLMAGDGSWREEGYGSYHSQSKTLADQVQVIAMRLGYKAIQFPADDGWTVSITSGSGRALHLAQNTCVIPYTGAAWCFETPTGCFVTRRNGRIAFHGNTKHGHTLPYGYMLFMFGGKIHAMVEMEDDLRAQVEELAQVALDRKVNMSLILTAILRDGLGPYRTREPEAATVME